MWWLTAGRSRGVFCGVSPIMHKLPNTRLPLSSPPPSPPSSPFTSSPYSVPPHLHPPIPPHRLTAGSPPAFDILSLQLTRSPSRARPGRGRRRRIRRRNAERSRRKPSLSPCTPARSARCATWSTRRRHRTLTSSTSSSTRASTCDTRCDHWFERIRYIDRVCVCVRDRPITDPPLRLNTTCEEICGA